MTVTHWYQNSWPWSFNKTSRLRLENGNILSICQESQIDEDEFSTWMTLDKKKVSHVSVFVCLFVCCCYCCCFYYFCCCCCCCCCFVFLLNRKPNTATMRLDVPSSITAFRWKFGIHINSKNNQFPVNCFISLSRVVLMLQRLQIGSCQPYWMQKKQLFISFFFNKGKCRISVNTRCIVFQLYFAII